MGREVMQYHHYGIKVTEENRSDVEKLLRLLDKRLGVDCNIEKFFEEDNGFGTYIWLKTDYGNRYGESRTLYYDGNIIEKEDRICKSVDEMARANKEVFYRWRVANTKLGSLL